MGADGQNLPTALVVGVLALLVRDLKAILLSPIPDLDESAQDRGIMSA